MLSYDSSNLSLTNSLGFVTKYANYCVIDMSLIVSNDSFNFIPNTAYNLTATVTIAISTTTSENYISNTLTIFNDAPSGGHCYLVVDNLSYDDITNIAPLISVLEFTCSRWKDDDGNLTYAFSYNDGK